MQSDHESSHASETVHSLFKMMKAGGSGKYYCGKGTELDHCLETANIARQNGADQETILACLLHDIGQFLPLDSLEPSSPTHSTHPPLYVSLDAATEEDAPPADFFSRNSNPSNRLSVGRALHDKLGATYLGHLGFSEEIVTLVRAHVDARRYLAAKNGKAYTSKLAFMGRAALSLQGGPMTQEEIQEFEELHSSEELEQVTELRKWDDEAQKSVAEDKLRPGLDSYYDMAVKSLLQSRQSRMTTAETGHVKLRLPIPIK